jgi:hemerythrin superfamily protein
MRMRTKFDTYNLVTQLLLDHWAIEDAMTAVRQAAPDARSDVFWEFIDAFVRHEVAEEVVVFPVVRKFPGGARIAYACIGDQADVEEKLARLQKVDAHTQEFVDGFASIATAVAKHFQLEERDVIPLLTTSLTGGQLSLLGDRYTRAKRSAPERPPSQAPETSPENAVVGPVIALVDRIRDAANST